MPEKIKWLPCPGCQHPIRYYKDEEIEVNAESRQFVPIEGLWMAEEGCTNPFCKWSKV